MDFQRNSYSWTRPGRALFIGLPARCLVLRSDRSSRVEWITLQNRAFQDKIYRKTTILRAKNHGISLKSKSSTKTRRENNDMLSRLHHIQHHLSMSQRWSARISPSYQHWPMIHILNTFRRTWKWIRLGNYILSLIHILFILYVYTHISHIYIYIQTCIAFPYLALRYVT